MYRLMAVAATASRRSGGGGDGGGGGGDGTDSSPVAEETLTMVNENGATRPNMGNEETSSLVWNNNHNNISNKSKKNRPVVGVGKAEKWDLPVGAEQIVKLLAAEMILHQMLNEKLSRPNQLEVHAIYDLVTKYPGTCLRTYEFRWEDGQTRLLYPFAMLCCLRPPLPLVELLYRAHPPAISTAEPKRGSLPLHYACAFQADLNVVQFLHNCHPQAVSTPRKDYVYPLHLACGYYDKRGGCEVIDFLLDRYPDGAKQRCTDLYWFPLHSAAQGGAPTRILRRLYELYPDSIEGLDKYGKTPLHTACRSKGNLENVRFLICVGPQALPMEDYGHFKPIFLASMYQTVEVLQLLLEHTPDRMDAMGATLLHWAAVRNDASVVRYLAQTFPDMLRARTRDRDRYTALLGACLNEGCLESIRALIECDPSTLDMADGDGRLPVEAAQHAHASAAILDLLRTEHEKYNRRKQVNNKDNINNNIYLPPQEEQRQPQEQPQQDDALLQQGNPMEEA